MHKTIQKIFHSLVAKIITGFIVVIGIYLASQYLMEALFKVTAVSKEISYAITGIISAVLVFIGYICLNKFYEKRKTPECSTKGFVKNVITGILLGAFLQSLTILVMYWKGYYSILSVNDFVFIVPGLIMAFSSSIFEEILFRGVLFRLLEGRLGSYAALGISALVFGLLHLLNPNSSLIAALALAVQAGLLLGAAFMYAGNLWFPIAIHFAWNFTQAGIFGAAVSGNEIDQSLFISKTDGPVLITGGVFGPEGSLQATIFCLIATIVLLILSKRKVKKS